MPRFTVSIDVFVKKIVSGSDLQNAVSLILKVKSFFHRVKLLIFAGLLVSNLKVGYLLG